MHLYKAHQSNQFPSITNLHSAINYSTIQQPLFTMNTQSNTQEQHQQHVMVLVPMEIYLDTGLGTQWITQYLQKSTPNTTTTTQPSLPSSESIKKKVRQH